MKHNTMLESYKISTINNAYETGQKMKNMKRSLMSPGK